MYLARKLIEELYLKIPGNLAYTDRLTGCYNINYYIDRMCKDFDKKTAHLYVIDVNRLKLVNDTEGHQAGDALLIDIAKQLMMTFEFVIRYGGDEFIAVSKDFKEFPHIDRVSYGYTKKWEDEHMMEAFKRADKSMYAMKFQLHDIR